MPEEPTPQPDPSPDAPSPRGYFNQAQLDDIDEAVSVLSAARAHQGDLSGQDITPVYLDGLEATIGEAQTRTAEAGLKKDQAITDTTEAVKAAKALMVGLRRIQSSARQKFRMLAEDGDPATNFPLDGYLIGARINANRATLIQSAGTLITRATEDNLPGFTIAGKVAAIQALLDAYAATEDTQAGGSEEKGLTRLSRDALIDVLNNRRTAVQFAADALWPYTDEMTRPIRSAFKIPTNRPLAI